MACRKEGIFYFNAVQSTSSEKENQNPTKPSAALLATHKPLDRRVTCPNFSTGLALRDNPDHQHQPGAFINGLRKPLSTLNALNRNLQKIFKRSTSAKDSSDEKSEATTILEDSDVSFEDISDEVKVKFCNTNVPDRVLNEEKILYGYPYLEESIELQLLQVDLVTNYQADKGLKRTRAAIFDWIFSMQSYFSLSDVVSHMTIQILDQCMNSMHIQENDLQIAAGAAFWMAAKVDGCDVNAGKISGCQIKKFLSKSCSLDLLKRAEFKLFKSLNFCLPRDSVLSVYHYQLHMLKPHLQVDEELTLIGQFALEAGMMCPSLAFSGFAELASTATMAACLLSSTKIEDQVWDQVASFNVGFSGKKRAEETSIEVLRVLMSVQGPKKIHPNLRAKYNSVDRRNIASNPKLSLENIIRVLNVLWDLHG